MLVTICAAFTLGAFGCSSNEDNDANNNSNQEIVVTEKSEVTEESEVAEATEAANEPNVEVPEESVPAPEESATVAEEVDTVADYYQFEDSDEDTLAALIYLGYGEQEKKERLQSLIEQFGLTEDLFEEVIIHQDCEWYAVFPKYIGSTVKVDSVVVKEEGELVKDEEKLETEKPVLICCNVSDIFPSSQVTVSYKDQEIQWNPFLSLEDGNIAKVDRVYTAKWE